MNYMKTIIDLLEWKLYLQGKYGSDYRSALIKLRIQTLLGGQAYDKNYMLKKDLMLTARERVALQLPVEYFDEEQATLSKTIR